MFLQLQTSRRHVSRLVATGVSQGFSLAWPRNEMDPNYDFIPGNVTTFTDFVGLVIPNLFVDKVDRCILELQMEPEDVYSRSQRATPGALWSLSIASRVVQFRRRLLSVAQRVSPNLFVEKVDR